MKRVLVLVLAIALLSGCDRIQSLLDDTIGDYVGISKTPLPGERQTVLPQDQALSIDPQARALPANIPAPSINDSWPQAGGVPGQNFQHLALGGLGIAWRVNVGTGANTDGLLVAPPVVLGGVIYVMDARSVVRAFEAGSGRRAWQINTRPEQVRSTGSAGGIAVAEGRVFAATGYAEIVAMDAGTGNIVWRQTLTAPGRAAPTVAGGVVFVTTIDNQITAYDARTGARRWNVTGITETAGFYGMASPSVSGTTVIATFSSGEIFALRTESGRQLWQDTLSGLVRTDAISGLADIRGQAVIEGNQVIVVSNGGRTVSFDLRTGNRNWEREIGSRVTPWVAGDVVFVMGGDGRLAALNRRDGRVRWITEVPVYRNPNRRDGRIEWTAPILAGGRLIVANSNRDLYALNPDTGAVVSRNRLPGGVTVRPIVVNNTLYVLTEDATLIAMR